MPEPFEDRHTRADFLRTVRAIAAQNAGAVTRRALLDAGFGRRAIDHARDSKRLFDVHRGFGVYSSVPPELLTEEAQLIAALAAVDNDAALGLGTAAHQWQLVPAPPFEIELVSRNEHASPNGVIVRRFRALRATDLTTLGRFPITSVERTLLDMAIRYAPDPLDRALAEAEFQHDIRPADVLAVLRRGHPGSGSLRASLERHVPGYGQMHSGLERRFRRLLIAHGIELPVRNERAGGYRVDCLWRHLNLIVELDGGQHERQHRRAADARRDTHLRAQGFVVVRYSWEQVFHHPQEVIDDLLRTMAGLSRRSETSSARAG